MNKIIKIELANKKVLRITFLMTTSCTYACRYCPESLHAGIHRNIDLDKLRNFLTKFSDRKIIMILTGGECTTHPQFIDVIKLFKEYNCKLQVDSNSVRTKRFYEGVKDLVDNWNITLHPSQHKFDLDKIAFLSNYSFLVIYIAMDPLYWDTSVNWYNQARELPNVKVTPIKLINDWAGAACTLDYTSEQECWLLDNEYTLNITPERYQELSKTHSWLLDTESVITYEDNTTEKLDPLMLIKENKNIFTGYKCYAGNDSIEIYDNGTATWANCGIRRYSDYSDIDPIELKNPITCTLSSCTCSTDIRSTKFYDQST
jgi:hypothetical protein